ncbi:MAG: preprotein translocase subunit SecG [Ferruginibacter sp.]|nr:preprotein translocase subunit SecG [Ferruginibacter sp.]
MLILFGILVILASVILGLIVLVQNPKGGGLSGSLGGFSNQLMGVKQTTDVLEKGTWIFAGIVGVLCIISPVFIPKNAGGSSKNDELINKAPASAPQPQNNVLLPGAQVPLDTNRK